MAGEYVDVLMRCLLKAEQVGIHFAGRSFPQWPNHPWNGGRQGCQTRFVHDNIKVEDIGSLLHPASRIQTSENRVDMEQSKDNVVFAVRSVDANGHRSIMVVPEPDRQRTPAPAGN
jgi:hypothetical protein